MARESVHLTRHSADIDRHNIVACVRVHKILIDESAWSDDTGDSAVVHQPARLDLVCGRVGELFGDGDMAVEILDENFEESIQLEEGEPGLQDR